MKADFTCLDRDAPVLVACSGGRDSMALLVSLLDAGYRVAVAHVNHRMRPTADRDEALVRDFCAQKGLPCRVFRADPPPATETAARAYRYRCLDTAARESSIAQIALAHHRGDQAETVLMHLLRGCGTAGAAGMRAVSGPYRRPLLGVSRAEIDAFVAARAVPYADDESNLDEAYTRNHLRRRVLPEIAVKYPEYERALCRFAAESREVAACLDTLLPDAVETERETLLPESLAAMPPVLIRRAVYRAARRFLPAGLTRAEIERVAALYPRPTGTVVPVRGALRAVRDYGGVTLYLDRPQSFAPLPWQFPAASTRIGAFTLAASPAVIPAKPDLVFDADKVPAGAIWRTRRPGDVFTPFGGGTRPLKEFLIDRKVPARTRDKLPLLCYNEIVFVVAGVEISRAVRLDKNSRRPATLRSTYERSQTDSDL